MYKKKVLMIQTSNSGVAYWRLYNFWKAMHRNNLADCRVLWWQKDMRQVHNWQSDIVDPMYMARMTGEMNAYARESDVVVFQSLHTEAALSVFYALKDAYPRIPIVSESDDDITDTPTYNPAFAGYRPGGIFLGRQLAQFKHSDAMIVSTPYLREVYEDYNPNIYAIPNCIDNELWGKVNHKKKPGIRIGWAGGASHDEDLRIVEPVVHEILDKHQDVTFVFVHGIPQFLKNIERVECVRKFARIDKYPQHLASQGIDIGLAPLVDNKFNRAKTNLRWLEMAALGIPTVASRVGHFAQTTNDGIDILMCDSPEDFTRNLSRLITNRDLRKSIGKAAHVRVQTDFNVDNVVREYVRVLEEVIARGPVVSAPEQNIGYDANVAALPLLEMPTVDQ